ncbi:MULTISPECIES: cupin domain-containing protein [Halorussus]|uniref:cupin domain-containing protein n=1 Tax=Halorussus TaxID=1070314 RepID=UPI00209E7A67|nr:cupin domain-containing protein [Halorussus vallis]USZ75034.1 cupin domain-containing protein [Halorussus vallis]
MDQVHLTARETEEAVDGVHFTQLAAGENMSIQHFRIDAGATIPEHTHDHEQLGYMTSGELVAVVDGEEYRFGPDDSYCFLSGEPHAAENRGDESAVGIGIYSPPRREADWK